jgi:2-desacetyl-2-hydroxyethyl bacteriochlorophyllide A dehydrogenase
MKAAVLRAPEDLVVEEVPRPEPPPGWVRVKVRASGICGSDLHIYTGQHPWLAAGSPMEKFVLGNVYGHEVAGTIDALGAGTTLQIGARVALNAILPCLHCEYCRVGKYQICPNLQHYGFHQPGGFAEYVLAPEANAVPLPDRLSFAAGALLDVVVVGLHAVQRAGVSLSDRVAVLGAGPIGLAAAAAAVRAGARTTAMTVQYQLQQRLAELIGVEHVVLVDAMAAQAATITGGRGFDVVIEAVGYKADVMQRAIDLVCRGGRIVFTGVYEAPVTLDFGTLLAKEASISASHAFGNWGFVPELELATELVAAGRFPVDEIVTHRYPLEAINEAFRTKLDRPTETAKVQIVFEA